MMPPTNNPVPSPMTCIAKHIPMPKSKAPNTHSV